MDTRKDTGTMADKIVIEGIQGYDGEYEFEFAAFTNRELHRIRLMSGIRARELADAALQVDVGFVVAVAVVVLARAGHPVIEDLLWDAEGGSVKLIFGALGADAGPPAEQETLTLDDGVSGSGAKSSSSGESSRASSGSQATTQ